MSFSFKKYFELIFNKELDRAVDYRKNNMPKILYKYVSLSEKSICKKDDKSCLNECFLDGLKLSTLKEKKIWMSKFRNLNDPYEYKCMYLEEEKLKEKGWPIDNLNGYLEEMKNVYNIASFTTNLVDNMPMWAHYSNNHHGFCIEYHVLVGKAVYPISYEEDRFSVSTTITRIFEAVDKIEKGIINTADKEFQFCMTMITHFGLIKHNTWSYENEYRVLFADTTKGKSGVLVDSLDVGLQVKAIYLGSQCSEENRKKLLKIAKEINVRAYEMYLDNSNPEYKLSYKELV